MNKILISLLALQILTLPVIAQQKISLENIWQDYLFYPNSVPGFNFQNDGKHYTRLEKGQVKQYDFSTGEFTKVIFDAAEVKGQVGFEGAFDSYTFSEDESKMLIATATESIYRHSTRSVYYIYDRKSKKMSLLTDSAMQSNASFNPQADKVAYVMENNLYYKDLVSGKEVQMTRDGKANSIINGATDWVYEEEFGFAKAFEWSPDGKKIAFLRFDESRVQEFTMTNYRDDVYPEYETFKYPKVGEDNSIVNVFIFNAFNGKSISVETGSETDIYFPRIKWTNDPNQLCVYRMNRLQNHLELLLADASTGATRTLFEEKNKYYIDITDDLTFLKNGKQFIWTSEQDGYNHIYLYDMNGKKVKQLTEGKFDVSRLYGVDEKNDMLYYQAAEISPLQREVYAIGINNKKKQMLSPEKGWNSAQFSSTFDYFTNNYSTASTATTYTVYNRAGKVLRVLEDNAKMGKLQKEYGTTPVEFLTIKTEKGIDLNAWMIKPPNFSKGKKYPVLMYVYGGPGSQTVEDKFGGFNYWWHQMLAQKGYIVVSVDNRGTGARGEEFKKMTYKELGKYETIDQIDAAKYLSKQPYVDAERIGIWGWSYGGYMSSLCILKGNDVFKTAIAVAPVTNWKWYDTVYTERYMQTDKENAKGYQDNSPVYFADQLIGNYLIVHGMADDNVHFQNTAEMVNALVMANKQFDTYFYPNRNHGIYGGPTRLHLYNKMTTFLLNNL